MIPTFREVLDQAGAILRGNEALGAILIDLSPLARIERSYGGPAYQTLRAQIDPVMLEVKERVRETDLLTRDEREGDRFLLLLSPRRQSDHDFVVDDLRKLADRIEEFVAPRVQRLTLPYLRQRPVVQVGYGLVLYSPLESDERQVLRLIDDAGGSAELRRRMRERGEREQLLEIVYNRRVWTAFQPILDLETRQILGYEALSRGPRGSELEAPSGLFGLAARQGLTEELERVCRRRTFVDWEAFGAPGRLFVNTVPGTVRDPTFSGRGVLDYLGPNLSPRMVTLEITEREVIANLSMYREAMHAFTELGFTFAIDDVGAGYSGLETMVTLGASYFKIDMSLVRDVHIKRVGQQVIKAILDMGTGAGATVIAEGVQTEAEAGALQALGMRYAQGYLWGRPLDPYAPKPRLVLRQGRG
jgi:EAL domain-containing protein (putative c-di-GMP-specific phosphodiesterase class I)/GGDEF domain-containing protein